MRHPIRDHPFAQIIIGGAAATIIAAVVIAAWDHITSSTPTHSTSSPVASASNSGTGKSLPASPSPRGTNAASEPTVIAHYSVELSNLHAIPLVRGGAPQPGPPSTGDLQFISDNSVFIANDGEVALFDGAPASYADCVSDGAVSTTLNSVAQGQTVCFQGHGVVAAAIVDGYATSGGVAYATLDVTVWQN